ncbi:hypothetical protein EIP91_007355 [Steccherinum ochraceum]|uniref:Uncharacterized protein n=1 Tax=Steccherinum ochraceum TaxID=92696 RepID=A0A4R0S296_9APHY|nr:hypothetical protein EIP91_007355 [Steccherinum ochraceum]
MQGKRAYKPTARVAKGRSPSKAKANFPTRSSEALQAFVTLFVTKPTFLVQMSSDRSRCIGVYTTAVNPKGCAQPPPLHNSKRQLQLSSSFFKSAMRLSSILIGLAVASISSVFAAPIVVRDDQDATYALARRDDADDQLLSIDSDNCVNVGPFKLKVRSTGGGASIPPGGAILRPLPPGPLAGSRPVQVPPPKPAPVGPAPGAPPKSLLRRSYLTVKDDGLVARTTPGGGASIPPGGAILRPLPPGPLAGSRPVQVPPPKPAPVGPAPGAPPKSLLRRSA